MNRGGQECGQQKRVSGVLITCHRTRSHDGPHSSSTYGTRWRDSGELLPPPAASPQRRPTCSTRGCSLWRDHAGPHGEELTLL